MRLLRRLRRLAMTRLSPVEENGERVYNRSQRFPMDQPPTDWVTLATTPPSSAEEIDHLVSALNDKGIEIALEDNPVRQCDQDVATWLRVHSRDLPLAWNLARKFIS
jgi:hypothetical protein